MPNLTVKILQGIREDLASQRTELQGVRTELGDAIRETNGHLEALERRQTSTEVRLATELTCVVGAIHELRDVLLDDRELRRTVAEHEQRLGALEAKVL